MTERERKKYLQELAKEKNKALKSKNAALEFLKQLGIVTDKGKLKSPYKNICTPGEVAL